MFSTSQVAENKDLFAQMEAEISKLEENVNHYNYAALRVVDASVGNDKQARASVAATQQFVNMFAKNLRQHPDKNIAAAFKTLDNQPKEAEEVILKLAETLHTFRSRIQEQENKFFSDIPFGQELAKLRSNDTWTGYFKTIMSDHLEHMPSINKHELRSAVDNLNNLCSACFNWIESNAPSKLEKYTIFQPANWKNPQTSRVNGSPNLYRDRKRKVLVDWSVREPKRLQF